jgi:hypothetical protein
MNIYNILSFFTIIYNVLCYKNVKSFIKLKETKMNFFYNDLEKMSLLSKIIYDYDYNDKNKKEELQNLDSKLNFIRCDNFNCVKLDYLDLLSKSELIKNYDVKKRLQSIILINHELKEIIVIFRGSIYFNEWFANLDIKEAKLDFNKNLQIHNGIYQLYKENNLFLNLSELYNKYPNYRKILTGHSRGSINSILSALELDFRLDYKYNYEIFCFGMPPIFNSLLSDYIYKKKNIKIYNIINNDDIITLLKLKNKYHIGDEILLKDNKIYVKKHDIHYVIKKNINFNDLKNLIKNHDLCNYIENIISKK